MERASWCPRRILKPKEDSPLVMLPVVFCCCTLADGARKNRKKKNQGHVLQLVVISTLISHLLNCH